MKTEAEAIYEQHAAIRARRSAARAAAVGFTLMHGPFNGQTRRTYVFNDRSSLVNSSYDRGAEHWIVLDPNGLTIAWAGCGEGTIEYS